MQNAGSFFFPLDVRLRLGTEGYSPAVLAKATRVRNTGRRDDRSRLNSSVFPSGAEIPQVYTCDGADRPPPLPWSGLPAGTRSLAR